MTGSRVRRTGISFSAVFFVAGLVWVYAQGTAAPDVGLFLDKAAQRVKSYPELKNWRSSVVTTTTTMDRNWTPESVLVVTKNVIVTNGKREEEILKAEETKKRKTKDITRKYAEDARKRREKERKRRAEEQSRKDGDEKHSGRISLDELLPFSEKKRGEFDFRLTENVPIEGKTAVALDASAKIKNEKNWEGRFYFDPETYNLLRVEVKPSEYPKMVKEFEIRITFVILQGRYLATKSSWIKINGGMFIKHIRQLIEEEYSEIEIMD